MDIGSRGDICKQHFKTGGFMTKTIEQTVTMLEMLPTQEQNQTMELIKPLVLACDPDYTRLTPEERTRLEAAENGEYVDSENIDWND